MVHITLIFSTMLSFLKENTKKILLLPFAVLFIFAALRYDYGNDYMSYANIFKNLTRYDYNLLIGEELFVLLNKISPSYQVMLIVVSLFFLFMVYKLISENVNIEYFGIAFLIFVINPYLFLVNLSAVRQSIAIALFIIAIEFAYKRKIIPYIIFIAIATLFHNSAIVLLPIYFIANGKELKKWQIITVVGIFIFILLTPDVLFGFIEEVLSFLDNANYNYYFDNGTENSLRATFLSALYGVYVLMNINRLSGKKLMFAKLYLLSIAFAVLAIRLSMLTRIQMYFDIFSVVAIPAIIEENYKNNDNYESRIINIYGFPLLLLAIYLLRYYSFFTNDLWESFVTYKTIFEA